jgi:hypothetical protein
MRRAPGGHADVLAAEPREYERIVVGFLDRAPLTQGVDP